MICPHCGAELKQGATFCPHCGSDKDTGWSEGAEFTDLETPDYDEILENEFDDKKTGWKEGAEYSDLDLPDYDEIVENEFGEKKKKSSPLTIIAVVIVALAFMAAMVL